MPCLYRANRGNLLQHWTLCEILVALQDRMGKGAALTYVDAHAMCPRSMPDPSPRAARDPTRPELEAVQRRLAGPDGPYLTSWSRLVDGEPAGSYPSSAAFVDHLWGDHLAMVLCEREPDRREAIAQWATGLRPGRATLAPGNDWRLRFAGDAWPEAAVLLCSFDPYRFDPSPEGNDPADLHAGDPARIVRGLSTWRGPLVVQASTYSTNGGNPLERQRDWLLAGIAESGLTVSAEVRARGRRGPGDMLSLVLTRAIAGGLPGAARWDQRFAAFLVAGAT